MTRQTSALDTRSPIPLPGPLRRANFRHFSIRQGRAPAKELETTPRRAASRARHPRKAARKPRGHHVAAADRPGRNQSSAQGLHRSGMAHIGPMDSAPFHAGTARYRRPCAGRWRSISRPLVESVSSFRRLRFSEQRLRPCAQSPVLGVMLRHTARACPRTTHRRPVRVCTASPSPSRSDAESPQLEPRGQVPPTSW